MDVQQAIDAFLRSGPFAVAGASIDRSKYGNKILRCYLQHRLDVYAVNPNRSRVEGVPCYPTLNSVPLTPRSASIITPPDATERIVADAVEAGVEFLWMQPGAESRAAVEAATAAGLTVIAGGPCLLVKLGFVDE